MSNPPVSTTVQANNIVYGPMCGCGDPASTHLTPTSRCRKCACTAFVQWRDDPQAAAFDDLLLRVHGLR